MVSEILRVFFKKHSIHLYTKYAWIYIYIVHPHTSIQFNTHQYEYTIYRIIVEPDWTYTWPPNIEVETPMGLLFPWPSAKVISRYSNVSVAAIYFSQLGLPGGGWETPSMLHRGYSSETIVHSIGADKKQNKAVQTRYRFAYYMVCQHQNP